MDNCPSLKDKRVCSSLSQQQGWDCSVDEETCRACGGPTDVPYLTVLGERLDGEGLKRRGLPTQVSEALAKRYPTEADRLLKAEEYRAKKGWSEVRDTWAKAQSFTKSMVSRGVTSKEVSLPQLQARTISCHGETLNGATVGAPCSKRKTSAEGSTHYCGACGCGDTQLARLDGEGYTKLHYPYLECPLGRGGFSNQKLEPMAFTCHGGVGDLCIHAWMAEGYRAQGGECGFVGAEGSKRTLLECLGQSVWETFGGSPIRTGGDALHYRYEIKVDKGARDRALVWSEFLGGVPLKRPTLQVSQRPPIKADIILEGMPHKEGRPLVLLFPYAEWKPRVWPINYWMDLYWGLKGAGCDVMVLGASPEGVQMFKDDGVAGHSWDVVMELMGRSQLVVANDSGPAHVAGTLGVNTIALMGPTSNIFGVYQTVREASVSREVLPCTGCHFDGARGFRAACDLQCESLMTLKPRAVLEACALALSEPLVATDAWSLPPDASPRNQS